MQGRFHQQNRLSVGHSPTWTSTSRATPPRRIDSVAARPTCAASASRRARRSAAIWPAARTTMSPIRRPARSAGPPGASEEMRRPVVAAAALAGRAGHRHRLRADAEPGPGDVAVGEQRRDHAGDGRGRHDDAVAARQGGGGQADHRAAGIGHRRAREAVVDAAVEPDQPVEAAAEPGLPGAGGAVDDARAGDRVAFAAAADGDDEMAGAHAPGIAGGDRREGRAVVDREAEQGDVGRRVEADQRRLDALRRRRRPG